MSKLSASHLFDAMQAFHGPHSVPTQRRTAAFSVERLASFLEAGSTARASRLAAADLAQAIRHSFNLDLDRIVADPTKLLDLPTVPIGRHLRFDAAHRPAGDGTAASPDTALHEPDTDDLQTSAAETLSAARGVAYARETLLGDHWIIVVLDARAMPTRGMEHHFQQLAGQTRVLIIWCETNESARNPTAPGERRWLEEMCARCGISQLGPLSDMLCDDLVMIFQALKVMDRASLVQVRLCDESTAETPVLSPLSQGYHRGTHATPPASDGGVRWPRDTTTLEAVEATLLSVAGRQPRAVIIDARPGTAKANFSSRLGRRYFASAFDDHYLWQWCAGLVSGGCQPILLIDERQWLDAASSLAALPDGVELPTTLVVFDGQSTAPSAYEPGEILPEATIAEATDPIHFESLLLESLGQAGLTIIWAPASEASRDSGLRLRFDASTSIRVGGEKRLAQTEREAILGKQFSGELASWIAAYERIGKRGSYIWKWCLHGVELTTLSCVPPALRADLCDTKVMSGMLNVVIDDIADCKVHESLLAELFKLTYNGRPRLRGFTASERRYGQLACDLWSTFWGRVKRYPCYDPYAALLQFDLAQLFNTVRYSHLVNSNPYILNVVEHDDYSPQGMGLVSFAMVDLMCSPDFSVTDLGRVREAMWHAQWMARIGNLVTTWQREVKDRDYTSGVFAHAVANRDITIEELLSSEPEQIEAAIERGGHERYFLGRWQQHRRHVERLIPHVKSVDVRAMLRGLERLLQTELVSRGKK